MLKLLYLVGSLVVLSACSSYQHELFSIGKHANWKKEAPIVENGEVYKISHPKDQHLQIVVFSRLVAFAPPNVTNPLELAQLQYSNNNTNPKYIKNTTLNGMDCVEVLATKTNSNIKILLHAFYFNKYFQSEEFNRINGIFILAPTWSNSEHVHEALELVQTFRPKSFKWQPHSI